MRLRGICKTLPFIVTHTNTETCMHTHIHVQHARDAHGSADRDWSDGCWPAHLAARSRPMLSGIHAHVLHA